MQEVNGAGHEVGDSEQRTFPQNRITEHGQLWAGRGPSLWRGL